MACCVVAVFLSHPPGTLNTWHVLIQDIMLNNYLNERLQPGINFVNLQYEIN